ncbi:uncharacterized protein LOC132695789 [Cylas formicarius]|uniref:uncharacterized protein LOC132695789 n=1 Tax=Cylas formicarius TaxID=197179 RepID=UPI0029586F34|nr:uncharacterized protein LOC132695789 [Cylas formicarius]
MRIYLYFLICLFSQTKAINKNNEDIINFLNAQKEEVRDRFNEKLGYTKNSGIGLIEQNILGVYRHTNNSTHVDIFSMFNTTFVVINDEIFKIDLNNILNLQYFSTLVGYNYEDKMFFKTKQFREFGFIAIGLKSGTTQIYKSSNTSNFQAFQTIRTPNTQDAVFFVNENNLYLSLVGNNGPHLASSSIYKWLDTYFDEVHAAYTTEAIKILSFPYHRSEIMIILRNNPGHESVSPVYEFRSDRLKTIQMLTVKNPLNMDVFVENRHYLVIYSKSTGTLYVWNGFALELINTFDVENGVNKSLVVYCNTTALIVQPKLEKVLLYELRPGTLEMVDSKPYRNNYSRILDINNGGNESGNITFIVALSEDNTININAMSFKVHHEMEKQDDTLRKCFHNLEEQIYNQRSKLNQIKTFKAKGENNLAKRSISGNFDEVLQNETQIKIKLKTTKNRIETLKKYVESQGEFLIVNDKVTVNTPLIAKTIKAKQLSIGSLNGNNWTPDEWLRYNKSQTVKGPVTAAKIITKDLATNLPLFNDLLTNSRIKLNGKVNVKRISTEGIYASRINDISVQDIYLRSSTKPAKGVKKLKTVYVKLAKIETINEISVKDILELFSQEPTSKSLNFDQEVIIKDLRVRSIDNINWNDFQNSVFKIGEDDAVEGNLTFTEIKAISADVGLVNGVKPAVLLTKTTEQIVNSSIEFNYISATRIEAETVNEVSLKKSAALIGGNDVIKGPVTIDKVFVEKDLELVGPIDKSLFLRDGDRLIGTNESDFLQVYKGKIKVKGNLHVTDLDVVNNATFLVDNKTFSPEDLNQFWTKSTHQTIPVHFEATQGMKVSHLETIRLNDIPMSNFALNREETGLKGRLYFENTIVKGNITTNKSDNNIPNLIQLDRETVKNKGSFVLKGKKTFLKKLKVRNFVTNELNGIKDNEASTTKNPLNITDKYVFKTLVIKGNLVSKLESPIINDIVIEEMQKKIVWTNSPQNISNLDFKNLTVKNLYVENINGYNVEEYVNNLKDILSFKERLSFNIKGNVTIVNATNVSTINGHYVDALIAKNSNEIVRNVTFLKNVKIRDLKVSNINDVNFAILTRRLLYKRTNQTVTAKYTFENLKTDNLFVSHINDINVKNLINTESETKQEIFAPNGIFVKNATFLKSLRGKKVRPCDPNDIVRNFKYPESREWELIKVNGNVELIDENCKLYKILKNAVRKGSKNVITAPVCISGNVLANQVHSIGAINGVDLRTIADDAVLKDLDERQVIKGHKIFTQMEALRRAAILGNADIPIVQGVRVSELYNFIIHRNDVNQKNISGKKTFFAGLETKRFNSKTVAGILPEQIVDLGQLKTIPSALFDSLKVSENFDVNYVNKIDFHHVLNNRLLVDAPHKQITNAVCYFDNLEVKENLIAASINDIDMENVVYDIGKQTIMASKYFLENITVLGDAWVDTLNGVNISETYADAVLRGQKNTINGSLSISKPSIIENNITTEALNGYSMKKIIEMVYPNSSESDEENIIYNIQTKVKDIIFKHTPEMQYMYNELMYIERTNDIQVSIPNAIDARITQIKDYVLIHILSEESQEECNLPIDCQCTVQHIVEITPNKTLKYFLNKDRQRIYSYDEDNMTIHLITNSTSTDSHCKISQAEGVKEVSTISWSTSPNRGESRTFISYPLIDVPGYISGVEFFTLNGKTYSVISQYYDPISDTHELDCVVLCFEIGKQTASEIQKIPTRGAWTLYLMHTAQGVTLIIGNRGGDQNTEIYRFDEHEERFMLLRTVGYACSKAVGVVLGTDSFIILANEDAPLQVLKYNQNYQNYVNYQIIAADATVFGLSAFYVGGFGISDAYLCIVTEENYRIFNFQFIDGWRLESQGTITGLRGLVSFQMNNQQYLFASSKEKSFLLTVVKHGTEQ